MPVVSVSADQRKAANRTYHGCKVCLKTEAEGALFSATNYCGRQAKDKKPREGRPNVFYLKVQPCFFVPQGHFVAALRLGHGQSEESEQPYTRTTCSDGSRLRSFRRRGCVVSDDASLRESEKDKSEVKVKSEKVRCPLRGRIKGR